MHISRRSRLILIFATIVSLSLACNAGSMIPNIPAFPTFAPGPADFGTPTGSSPMSGDWSAQTDFGKIAFTVNPDGTVVSVMAVKMSNWTCGGDTLTTSLQVSADPPWSISDGQFSAHANLGDSSTDPNDLYVDGSYDKAANKFSGTWEQDAYGTTCTGKWETAARK